MTTVLLTGATGFVGRHILKQLERRGIKTVIPVRREWQYRIEIDETLTRVFETTDLFAEPYEWWCEVLKGVDMVIHSAWCAEPGSYLTSEKNLDCLGMTMQLAKVSFFQGVTRFVGLGSCIEYEMSDERLDIDHPLNPTTPYSGAKVAAFHALQQWFQHTDVSFLWCRLFHLYGAGEHPKRLFPAIHKSLNLGEKIDLTSGTQIRDFLPVEDAARLILEGAFSTYSGPANICSGKGRSVRELAEQIADQYQRRDLLNFGARNENLLDPPMIVGVPSTFKV
jgi:dTDP-6-deoxy-L-talose 4-dehydrogenase (NAD+)